MTYYWFKTCSHCNGQGRLFIFKNVNKDILYLHCEECEWGLYNPDDVGDPSKMFLTLDCEFESVLPDIDEIRSKGWAKYALHKLEE